MVSIFGKSGRFSLLVTLSAWFIISSFLLRLVFFCWEYDEVSWAVFPLIRTLFTGLFFDIGTISFIALPAVVYFSLLPDKLIGSFADRWFVFLFTFLTVFLLVFVFFAEITFWDEFHSRFNFIAVDYLIYTHEVLANIRQSYPLPVLVGGVLAVSFLVLYGFARVGAFAKSFSSMATFRKRIFFPLAIMTASGFYGFFITNNAAEWSANRYNSEIAKSGIYSFFAAFRNNQMKYPEFYKTISNTKAFAMARKKLASSSGDYMSAGFSIRRRINDSAASETKRNVVFILVESLSASFMKEFGSAENNTPFLDSLAQRSLLFSKMYATGTRTVRGMEAVTLCIPPTPGQSIVKRPENANLYTISNVFHKKGYDCSFFYGGDGYFDNMNAYFGGNGFTIYDRGRGSILSDKIKTVRHNIEDKEVTFENAWGICDEDIFNKMLRVADEKYSMGQPFFNFVMTTSNHRPYTYPKGKIAIPSGTSREGAVMYTDYALRMLFKKAAGKPWFRNTVFVIVADHCASSAGKNEIDVANYHIPAFVVNLSGSENRKIDTQCSQIDLFPTLFSLFHWNYESGFFGKDVLAADFEPRAFLGTYRKLALMKQTKTMILSDQKKYSFYNWEAPGNKLMPIPVDASFLEETIAWYQSADYLFTHKLLK